MSGILMVVLVIALVAVLGVLLVGVYGMGRGGAFNAKHGNKLMRWRIILQLVAVAIMVTLFFVNQG
ncbi:MAG: twin transmembrane helix small protein [Alphaproteobacteria bacterium]|jgi:preprotein translocase subunit SecG|nr:hypothetical protein [Rhodospirillaceae bacterium]MDP6023171.1 twin transmembrane helix small protein [Alphaproteobacteria bacterium]MDP6253586.1 twin transmembrane helix small protein [Alphaproteobacteria bacterium]MDP7055876.1 twin transmembrane helix small protein [Alphaproteobacteria bacterium]MDP7228991.1 twin transmembrane helix small protein [Alphaproteobacteria bacterium]|tara:strand:+ start:1579 stop:1776 length:198 start_codon:yes stop_codon:yes gene_type:complete